MSIENNDTLSAAQQAAADLANQALGNKPEAAPESDTTAAEDTTQQTAEEGLPQSKAGLSISLPMFVLMVVLLCTVAGLGFYALFAGLTMLLGSTFGLLASLAIVAAFEYWLFCTDSADSTIEAYINLFTKKPQTEAQAQAAADVAAAFAEQAPAEAAGFEGAVPA